MIEWSESHQLIRETVRRFVEAEIVPNLEALEHGDMPPYDILRKLYATFGIDEMNGARFDKMIARARADDDGRPHEDTPRSDAERGDRSDGVAMQLIPIIEICRFCPGMVTAMGVSVGLTGAAVMSKGTRRRELKSRCAESSCFRIRDMSRSPSRSRPPRRMTPLSFSKQTGSIRTS